VIVLDTNVLSELMRPEPHDAVLDWVAAQVAADLYVTTISYGELLFGVALLPGGARRDRLTAQAEAMFAIDFGGRLLTFDATAVRRMRAFLPTVSALTVGSLLPTR